MEQKPTYRYRYSMSAQFEKMKKIQIMFRTDGCNKIIEKDWNDVASTWKSILFVDLPQKQQTPATQIQGRERERDGSISHKLYFEDKPKAKKYYHVV